MNSIVTDIHKPIKPRDTPPQRHYSELLLLSSDAPQVRQMGLIVHRTRHVLSKHWSVTTTNIKYDKDNPYPT